MADTIRILSDFITNVFRDGQTKGSIKPQAHRDLAVSVDSWISAATSSRPTLEELETRALLPNSISATSTIYLGPTNLAQRLGALALSFSAAIAASDTDYWTIELQRCRANGNWVRVTVQTTKATGGLAIAANTAWTFDNAIWPSALRYLRKGDVLRAVLTKTGAPGNLSDGCAMLRYEPDVLALVRDTFSRVDSPTSMGSSEAPSSLVWGTVALPNSFTQSVFGIISGAAAIHTHANGARDYAVVDVGYADVCVSGVVLDVTNAGLAVRMAEGSPLSNSSKHPNGYTHNASAYFRSDNGTLVQVSALSPVLVNGDEVTIVISGPNHTIYKNGVQVGTGADSSYSSTRHGIRNSGTVLDTPLVDDFLVAL